MNRWRSNFRPVFLNRLRQRSNAEAVSEIETKLSPSKCANELLEAVNSASNTVRTVYLTLLSFSIFIAFTTGTLSDEKLLHDRTAILPIIENVELPLSTFYLIVPWMLVLIHAEAIIHFTLLANKVNALYITLRHMPVSDKEHIHKKISNFPFSHWLLGTQRHKQLNLVIGVLIWLTLVVLPLLVLVFAQLAFLPYQSEVVTWFQRIAVLVDTSLLLIFYPMLRGSTQSVLTWWTDAILFFRCFFVRRFWKRLRHQYSLWRYLKVKFARRKVGAFLLLIVCGTSILVSWFVATIPGENLEQLLIAGNKALGGTILDSSKSHGMSWGWGRSSGHVDIPSEFDCSFGLFTIKVAVYQEHDRPPSYLLHTTYPVPAYLPKGMEALCPTVFLFHSGIPLFQRFHRTLDVREITVVSSKISDDIELKLRSKDEEIRREAIDIILPIDLRGRNFRFADFSSARLPNADLRGIDATCARFNDALLDWVQFGSVSTNLLGAEFFDAKLHGADFNNANLALTSFNSSKLQGAEFNNAKMYGANLSSANLSGASLSYADLPAANLTSAIMTGASLAYADMRTSDLSDGILIAADLYAVDLRGANLQRVDLTSAQLLGTAIDGADFTRAKTQLNIIDLSDLKWDKPEKDKFLDDMHKVQLYQLGLERLEPAQQSKNEPGESFRPSNCGSYNSLETYGCININHDSSARIFAKRLLNYWADTACVAHQDPIVAQVLVEGRLPPIHFNIVGLGHEFLRTAAPYFARRLLSDKCSPTSHLDENTKDILREWVRK